MNDQTSEPELDYMLCTYGESSQRFRGPPGSVNGDYIAVMGGSEVFGRYVEDPFCDQIAEFSGRSVLNLGLMNGGLDAFVQDDALMAIIEGAETVIIQVLGAANLSNRFYRVHPRRNDRFLRQSHAMAALFPRMDFSDFAFTRHLLTALQADNPKSFAIVEQELHAAWIARMRTVLTRIPGRKVLLWIENEVRGDLGPEPLFVTNDMLQMIDEQVDALVHCDVSQDVGLANMERMIYPEMERGTALRMLTPKAHDRIAEALNRAVGDAASLAA